jgi:hypothetical protein
MNKPISLEFNIRFKRCGRGSKKEIREGAEEAVPKALIGRIPRISRFMALAIHYEDLIRSGHVSDFAELARLGHVTRARVTQIMNLRLLAPDIQEQLLLLPRIVRGRAEVNLRDLQGIAGQVDWRNQRKAWLSRSMGEVSPE